MVSSFPSLKCHGMPCIGRFWLETPQCVAEAKSNTGNNSKGKTGAGNQLFGTNTITRKVCKQSRGITFRLEIAKAFKFENVLVFK